MKRIAVALVDDHPPLRAGVAAIIGRSGRYEVVAEAGSVEEAARVIPDSGAAIVIVDVSLPDGSGIEVIRTLHAAKIDTKLLVLTMHARRSFADAALAAGACGYLLKESTGAHLVTALDAVYDGRTYLDPRLETVVGGDRAGVDAAAGVYAALSEREFEVFRLLASGRNSKEIGVLLGISRKTVDNHRSRVMEKLGLESIAGLVRLAVRTNVIEP